ncbi:MAG TPA: ArpU family phage packaging/lysis transcriptional regulator [Brevibacillus sp.]|nr:ArpU family phage packaging/lysis transcriptional regulator [Brevibacillus sp.]
MQTVEKLSASDRKAIRKSVEAALERYRLFKHFAFEEKEASVVRSYEINYSGKTNRTSDQTGATAIHNVDAQAARQAYCDLVERAVNRLPNMEKLLIQERYLGADYEYITDYSVYCHKFDPPISEGTYTKIRQRAMQKLFSMLGLHITNKPSERMTGNEKGL